MKNIKYQVEKISANGFIIVISLLLVIMYCVLKVNTSS